MWDWVFSGVLPEVSKEWDYAMITLVVRFVGVFVVMAAMQIALQASARGVRAWESRQAKNAGAAPVSVTTTAVPSEVVAQTTPASGLNDATIAAIGLSLALESRRPAAGPAAGAPTVWSTGWRMRQLPRSSGR
jgi:hypothetical protein